MRLGGRIGRANLPYDQVHPLILPGRHPLRRLLIHALHEKLRHAGTGFVVRQHVWLIGGREAVKRVRYSRRFCILQRGKPATQLMGELPISRLNIDALPFSRVAIDYFRPVRHRFGPKSDRRAKLFTCPTTRGVYLDLATSMSTDDFLLTFRHLSSFYGNPTDVFSDNGTNFVDAERELREAVEALHADPTTEERFKKVGVRWHFQTALTPHFGGAHESLVKSAKRALYASLEREGVRHRYPSEGALRTLFFRLLVS